MSKRARRVSLFFETPQVARLPESFGSTLASHLIGVPVRSGHTVHLPGWPPALVDLAEPEGAQVGEGTAVEIHAPPPATKGALSLVVVTDASLTMGEGDGETPFERAARMIDAMLLNGRGFISQAGLVVQGGAPRAVEGLAPPEDVAGASILKVDPKGTFDLTQGLEEATGLLDHAEQGPIAILVITDGDGVPGLDLETLRPVLHGGVVIVGLADEISDGLEEVCHRTGGVATEDPEVAFRKLAELAGTQARWTPPAEPTQPSPPPEDPYEFEVVLEAVDTPPRSGHRAR